MTFELYWHIWLGRSERQLIRLGWPAGFRLPGNRVTSMPAADFLIDCRNLYRRGRVRWNVDLDVHGISFEMPSALDHPIRALVGC
jgi:hypothetical protein